MLVCRQIEIRQAKIAQGQRLIRLAPGLGLGLLGIGGARTGLLRARQARNAVICDGGMGHVGGPQPGHMTADAFNGRLMALRVKNPHGTRRHACRTVWARSCSLACGS